MTDGSITFSTALDNAQLEKELAEQKKKIEKNEKLIAETQKKREEAAKTSVFKAAELDAEKVKLQEIRDRLQDIRTLSKDKGISIESRQTYAGQLPEVKAELADQQTRVCALQTEYNKLYNSVLRYDERLSAANVQLKEQKEHAGELTQQLNATGSAAAKMGEAVKQVDKYTDKLLVRVKKLASRVFIFTLITTALRDTRTWLGKAVKTNDEATRAIARLKGALLTLAQPLVNVVIPAFTTFVDVLAKVVSAMAQVVSLMFGTTASESAKAAEELYNEMNAIEGIENAAEEAEKSLASFDEINMLSGDSASKNANSGITPDFSAAESPVDTLGLNSVSEFVTIALLLAGIAFIAVGASLGNILMIIAGLTLLGAGIAVGAGSGVLQSWVDTLGLNSVQEFVVIAILLAGIAIVAIAAATGNILMVIAGLLLIGVTVAYTAQSGMLQDWASSLGLAQAAQYVTAALLIGGMALIVIGAATANILMVLAGLGLLGAGIYVGVESGTLASWADALGLDSVFGYVTIAIQLAGICFIAIGAAMGNIFMAAAGAVLLAAGIVTETIGEETLKNWWEVLRLTSVQQWVTVALLLVGIALVAVGAAMGNILMVLAGAAALGLSAIVGAQENNLEDWVTVLGLEKVAGWVTSAILLAGIAFIVIGIVIMNVLMVVAGIGLLISGFTVGTESGTLGSWVDALHLNDVAGKVSTALMLAGIAMIGIGAATMNIALVLAGLALLGVGYATNKLTASTATRGASRYSSPAGTPSVSAYSVPAISSYDIPALATGAVIPPNREFLAVLGDQKSGTNIEAPTSEIEAAVARGIQRAGSAGGGSHTVILEVDKQVLGRVTYQANQEETQRVGVDLVE